MLHRPEMWQEYYDSGRRVRESRAAAQSMGTWRQAMLSQEAPSRSQGASTQRGGMQARGAQHSTRTRGSAQPRELIELSSDSETELSDDDEVPLKQPTLYLDYSGIWDAPQQQPQPPGDESDGFDADT